LGRARPRCELTTGRSAVTSELPVSRSRLGFDDVLRRTRRLAIPDPLYSLPDRDLLFCFTLLSFRCEIWQISIPAARPLVGQGSRAFVAVRRGFLLPRRLASPCILLFIGFIRRLAASSSPRGNVTTPWPLLLLRVFRLRHSNRRREYKPLEPASFLPSFEALNDRALTTRRCLKFKNWLGTQLTAKGARTIIMRNFGKQRVFLEVLRRDYR